MMALVYHDEILNDLRRPAPKRLISAPNAEEEKDKKMEAAKGRYAIPRGGLFEFISFPNYFCEWYVRFNPSSTDLTNTRVEWTFWAVAAAPGIFVAMPLPGKLALPASVDRLLEIAPWPRVLLHPAWIFPIFLVSSMLPRAIRAHKWYITTFGERFSKDRKVAIPFVL
jgi:3-oxo-5-alpha-steroid 4-dehydrogenase 1